MSCWLTREEMSLLTALGSARVSASCVLRDKTRLSERQQNGRQKLVKISATEDSRDYCGWTTFGDLHKKPLMSANTGRRARNSIIFNQGHL